MVWRGSLKVVQHQVWTHDLPFFDVGLKTSWTNGRQDVSRCHGRNFLFDEKWDGSNTHALVQLKPSVGIASFQFHQEFAAFSAEQIRQAECKRLHFQIYLFFFLGAIGSQGMGTIFVVFSMTGREIEHTTTKSR